ncbi:calcipressin-3-like [Pollicipes pollicipes]|uniref:calcipressin-3-like n=1 Tax=Pollicipes pollicipes TaxID=41117 RepID=UPI001884E00F|nr:calcipressin-3-like [Pollicipes pollicipes]
MAGSYTTTSPSFRRARVNYSTPKAAASARIHLHETSICGATIKCYFIQPQSSRDELDDGTLHPPMPDKQFLISPPASPPVGWEPVREAEPTVNFDLLRAVTEMAPGESHELHDGRDQQPSIVVHVAEESETDRDAGQPRMRITQTRCPSR